MRQTPEELEARLQHFDRLHNNELVRQVLQEQTSFETAVDDFYDIKTRIVYKGDRPKLKFDVKEAQPHKAEQQPKDILGIVAPFQHVLLDLEKLRYDRVREDHTRWESSDFMLGKTFGLILTVAGAAEISLGLFGLVKGNYFAPLYTCVPGIALVYVAMKIMEKLPIGSNDERGEYLALHGVARRADIFMQEHYRTHLIKGMLSH